MNEIKIGDTISMNLPTLYGNNNFEFEVIAVTSEKRYVLIKDSTILIMSKDDTRIYISEAINIGLTTVRLYANDKQLNFKHVSKS